MREHLLYKREKNFVFSLIFKFSLSILELLFRDNFTKIKQKLKKILEKSKKITFQNFNHFFLIFKYPKYYKLPYGHLNSIDKTLFFMKIINDEKIKLFLIGGTVLGAVRQNAFAGREGVSSGLLLLLKLPLVLYAPSRCCSPRPSTSAGT